MSTVTQIETALAQYLLAMFPPGTRELVQGRIGEFPAPSSPAIIWRLDTFEPPDFTRTEDAGDDQIIHANTPLQFVITCLGDRPTASVRDDCFRAVAGLRLTQRTGDLFKLCGLWGVEPVRDLTALETGKMRQRAEFRLTLSADLTLADARETIEEVDLDLPIFDKTVTVEGPL